MRNDDTSKHLLGRLLATENITVEYCMHAEGPYFNLKDRTLVMPVWRGVTNNLKDLIIGHEVGHALFTPPTAWHDAVAAFPGNQRLFKTVLNVVEDARIERMMKDRYPGLRRPMFSGYTELIQRGFFDKTLRGAHVSNQVLPLIDRINSYCKLGVRANITFTPEEQQLLDAVEQTETFDDVVAVAHHLAQLAKDEAKQMKEDEDALFDRLKGLNKSGHTKAVRDFLLNQFEIIAGDNEKADCSVLGDPMSGLYEDLTKESRDETRRFAYVKVGRLAEDQFVLGVGGVHEHLSEHYAKGLGNNPFDVYQMFLARHDAYLKHLVREFEVRRNARKLDRARMAKTGELNPDKLWKNRLTDDLFLQQVVLPQQKNHGMIMLVDFSGSMNDKLFATLEQTVCLAMFCRKVGVPFEVYSFIDNGEAEVDHRLARNAGNQAFLRHRLSGGGMDLSHVEVGYVAPRDVDFRMQQLLTGDMSATVFKQAVINLLCLSHGWEIKQNSYMKSYVAPRMFRLGSTPLVEATLTLFSVAERFRQRHRVDVLNTIVLTDGDPSSGLYVRSREQMQPVDGTHVVMFDAITKKEVVHDVASSPGVWYSLLDLYRAVTQSRVIGFFVVDDILRLRQAKEKFSARTGATMVSEHPTCAEYKITGFDRFFVQSLNNAESVRHMDQASASISYYKRNVRKTSVRGRAFALKQVEEAVSQHFSATQKQKAEAKTFVNLFVRALS